MAAQTAARVKSPPSPKAAPGAQPLDSTPGPYRRVLLKLSGEAFCAPGGHGVDPKELETIASEVKSAHSTGAQIAVVVGGGNIVRGAQLAESGHIHQATADYMGMLATVINALALREKLITLGVESRVQSAIEIRAVAEPFIRGRALRHLEKGRIVILAAGTGNPFFTTDTCAALRATELECDILLKATKVDGVYSADPKKDPRARRFDQVSFADAIGRGLRVMDMTALAMCQERRIPVLVFDFKKSGNIRRVIERTPDARGVGTLVLPP